MGALVRGGQQEAAAVKEQEQSQYLTFLLGGEMFAIDILNIKEIIEYGSLTTVPMMPEFIRGVINLRGAAAPWCRWWILRSGSAGRAWKRRGVPAL